LLGSVVHKPELIVLDEPFSGLDPVNQEHLERLIRSEQARGATILFSTHVMGHAERLCDHLSIIVGGLVRFDGTVEEARSTMPMQAQYTPDKPGVKIAAMLPKDAQEAGGAWRFTVPDGGVEDILGKLIKSGHGIAGLTMQRPSLHDAFVKIVREAGGTVDLDEGAVA
jgi:ABC-2 type transport system ATP-binding protein